MARKDKRFIITHEEGSGFATATSIIVDSKTGVNYLFVHSGYAGGLSPLLDADGKPVVTRAELSGPEY